MGGGGRVPLAALTAYRALFAVGGLPDDESVLVLGAGSGVSTFAVQLAAQDGRRVLVTSSSQEKIDRAKELGAEGGVLYTEEGWPRRSARSTSCSTRSARRGSDSGGRCRPAGGWSSSAARAGRR